MISVELLETQIGRLTYRVGRIDIYVQPVKKEEDFTMVPADMTSFADVQAISIELSRNGVRGRVSWYEWRKIT